MTRRVPLTLLALLMALPFGGALTHAQSSRNVVADIGFAFVAGDKDMPAGKYTITVTEAGPLMVVGPDGARAVLRVITRLGRHDQDPDNEFVFDKIDGKSVLSEVWLPRQDGFLLVATSKPHSHAVLGGSNPRK
jgi:hypothetical protein